MTPVMKVVDPESRDDLLKLHTGEDQLERVERGVGLVDVNYVAPKYSNDRLA